MSMIGKGKRAAQEPMTPLVDTEDRAYCITFRRAGGGVVVSEGEVPMSAVTVLQSRPPELLSIAMGRVTHWIERRFTR
jgi:hypothetical protein